MLAETKVDLCNYLYSYENKLGDGGGGGHEHSVQKTCTIMDNQTITSLMI